MTMRYGLLLSFGILSSATAAVATTDVAGGSAPDYVGRFLHYATSRRDDIGQVRYMYANQLALAGARTGRMPAGATLVMEVYVGADADGADGPRLGSLKLLAVMEKEVPTPTDSPGVVEDWRFGLFTPAGEPWPDTDTSACLSCHQPLANKQFLFTFDSLKEAATGVEEDQPARPNDS